MPAPFAVRLGGGLLASACLLAVVLYAVFTTVTPPLLIIDEASPAWLAALVGYVSLQVFIVVPAPQSFCARLPFGARAAFFAVSAALSAAAGVCFAIYGRPDMTVWSVVLGIVLLLVGATYMGCGLASSASGVDPDKAATEPFHDAEAAADPPRASCCSLSCVGLSWNTCNLVVVLLFIIHLFNGGIVQATGPIAFPPRGSFFDLTLSTGDVQRIHYECVGPKNGTFPVYLADADGSHGLADFWPLQRNLTAAGRRICTYDAPGLGYSDRYYSWQHAEKSTYYRQLIDALGAQGEGSQFIFIAWGGGAEPVYKFALANPTFVAGFVFLDSFSKDVLYQFEAEYNSWSKARMNEYKSADLNGRVLLFTMIRGLAAPWGLLPIFVSNDPKGYAWPERFAEYSWNYHVPKTWTAQWFSLLPEFSAEASLTGLGVFDTRLAALQQVPVLSIVSNRSRADTCNEWTQDCDKAVAQKEFLRANAVSVGNVTGAEQVVYCTESDCALDMPLRKPGFVVDAIMRKWPL
ncbi:hypothetical protein FNF31_05346 [Cafeteria roenbergensis]|uniref:AB hydrolase-1 domain-containing protein n=1 Tax=Cafeteria roenbergensis TaxID=33653 RepID=A0A5A8D085_CAFRO|nr:hypothetical protein FNF31_05346 [Cafeteria roenbergensis]KAA0171069.1 hypothetical protein FNF28_01074 [Cafeteria roenbergensis]